MTTLTQTRAPRPETADPGGAPLPLDDERHDPRLIAPHTHDRRYDDRPLLTQLRYLSEIPYLDLVALAQHLRYRRPDTAMTWDVALGLLAQQLLADTGDAAGLRAFQDAVLRPLELELALGDHAGQAMAPEELFHFLLGPIVAHAGTTHG